jgi:hypothetical protein
MIRRPTRCAVLAFAGAVLPTLWPASPARGSLLGQVIAEQVSIDTYQHYLEDLLYTHVGDNRGFGPEHDLARANIQSTLESFGLPVELEPFTYGGNTYYNVVATQVGDDHPEITVVVGAHFDSANNPGADDNGSGTAMVMEAARILSQHRSPMTIKYVLFDREEQGLVGSEHFVVDHASSLLVGNVSSAIATYGDTLNSFVNVGGFPYSDHWPFESAGIPACVIVEDCYSCNPYYHSSLDAVDSEPGYISYAMLEDLVRSVVGCLVDTADITMYGDANGDGQVNVDDIIAVILDWGECPPPDCTADLNRDGVVDVDDLTEVILNWGT